MRRIAAVIFLLFLLAVGPRAFGQVVAGDFNPAYSPISIPDDADSCDFLICSFAQAFALGSTTSVSEIDVAIAAHVALPRTDTFLITVFAEPSGSPVLTGTAAAYLNGSVTLVPFYFSNSLPAGMYQLGLSCTKGCWPGDYGDFWAPNAAGSTKVGFVGAPQVLYCCHAYGPLPVPGDGRLAFQVVAGMISGPPVDPTRLQLLRLVAGPITPAPGTPVEAELGFLDMNGNPIGPSSDVTIAPGEMRLLDFNPSQFLRQPGQRLEVRPVIRFLPNPAGAASAPLSQFSASFQVLDAVTGVGTLLESLEPGAFSPSLVPEVLAGGQTMRFNAAAPASDSCTGQLRFADENGSPIGPTTPLNLAPGAGTSLDLRADMLGLRLGQRAEVQPILDMTAPPTAGAPLNSVCQASVEVFDNLTGRTRTYQFTLASLPAVQ